MFDEIDVRAHRQQQQIEDLQGAFFVISLGYRSHLLRVEAEVQVLQGKFTQMEFEKKKLNAQILMLKEKFMQMDFEQKKLKSQIRILDEKLLEVANNVMK